MSNILDKLINLGIVAGVSVIGYYYWKCARQVGSYAPPAVLPCLLVNAAEGAGTVIDDGSRAVTGGVSIACITTGSTSQECAKQYRQALCKDLGICL